MLVCRRNFDNSNKIDAFRSHPDNRVDSDGTLFHCPEFLKFQLHGRKTANYISKFQDQASRPSKYQYEDAGVVYLLSPRNTPVKGFLRYRLKDSTLVGMVAIVGNVFGPYTPGLRIVMTRNRSNIRIRYLQTGLNFVRLRSGAVANKR